MAATTTVSQLDGLFKVVYGDKLENLIPDNAILTKKVKFSQGEKMGKQYNFPVVLTNEHGVTRAVAGSGAFTLKSSIAMTTQEAALTSYQHVIRSTMDYEAAAKATSKGKSSFFNATELLLKNMLESMTYEMELDMLYGQKSIGATSVYTAVSATSTKLTINTADWAVGIWAGAENMTLNFYDGATLISAGTDAVFTVTAVDVDNYQITVTGSSAGITALETALAATTGMLDIYRDGAYGQTMAGIDKIITNTGTLFGISAATYNLWKGNSYAVGGNLTFEKTVKGLNSAIGRGLKNQKMQLFISPYTWTVLMNDLEGDRRYDSSYKKDKAETGWMNLELFSQNGAIEVISHNMVKQGEAFAFPVENLKRIGSTDVTFKNPGNNSEFFRELNDNAGFEVRAYSDQAIISVRPAFMVKYTGISN